MSSIYHAILNIFGVIAVISIVVFVHELGHYLMAVYRGINVEEFSIGFGKALISRKSKNGTQWNLRLFPIGGYVKIDALDALSEKNIKSNEKSLSNHISAILILISGSFANLFLGFFLLFVSFIFIGKNIGTTNIVGFSEESPSEIAGMQIGDVVYKVNKKEVSNINQLRREVALHGDKNITLKCKRNGKDVSFAVTPKRKLIKHNSKTTIRYIIGIKTPNYYRIKLGLTEALKTSLEDVWFFSKASIVSLYQIITGKRSIRDISGPIKIIKSSKDAVRDGFSSALYFLSVLSIGMGCFNILPLPALDGGQVMFFGIERIRNKKFSESTYKKYSKFGTIFLYCIIFFAIFNDLISMLITNN